LRVNVDFIFYTIAGGFKIIVHEAPPQWHLCKRFVVIRVKIKHLCTSCKTTYCIQPEIIGLCPLHAHIRHTVNWIVEIVSIWLMQAQEHYAWIDEIAQFRTAIPVRDSYCGAGSKMSEGREPYISLVDYSIGEIYDIQIYDIVRIVAIGESVEVSYDRCHGEGL